MCTSGMRGSVASATSRGVTAASRRRHFASRRTCLRVNAATVTTRNRYLDLSETEWLNDAIKLDVAILFIVWDRLRNLQLRVYGVVTCSIYVYRLGDTS